MGATRPVGNAQKMSAALERVSRSDRSLTSWVALLGEPTQRRTDLAGGDSLTVTWTMSTLGFLDVAKVVVVFDRDGTFTALADWGGLDTPPPANLVPPGEVRAPDPG
jgi:hypothetical protein